MATPHEDYACRKKRQKSRWEKGVRAPEGRKDAHTEPWVNISNSSGNQCGKESFVSQSVIKARESLTLALLDLHSTKWSGELVSESGELHGQPSQVMNHKRSHFAVV